MPKISIIIPVYNVSRYIERCLKSVIAQSYSNIECILVDDCTPDDSIEKCQEIISEYKGPIEFNILHHERNRGLSAARNTGTDAATGEYIYYLDSDDEITHDCIKLMVQEIEKHPEAEMVCGDSLEPYEGPQRVYHFDDYRYYNNNILIRYCLLCPQQAMPITAWNKLISLRFIRENWLFFGEGLIHEDVLWIYKLVLRISYLVLLPKKTYTYHLNDASIVSTTSIVKRSRSMIKILEEIAENLEEPLYHLALYKYLLRLFQFYQNLPYKEYQPIAKTFCKKLWRCGDRKLAVVIRFYFRFNEFMYIRKYENVFIARVRSRYYYCNNKLANLNHSK